MNLLGTVIFGLIAFTLKPLLKDLEELEHNPDFGGLTVKDSNNPKAS